MPTTRNYARGRVWQDTERIAMTLRVPSLLHERITRAALEREMTVNDLMLAILDHMLTPIGNTMKKATHYADVSDTTIWRVWFTPPEGMNEEQIEEWLMENWADCDCDQIHDKDVYDDGGTEIVFVAPMTKEG